MDVQGVSRFRPVMCSKRCCGFLNTGAQWHMLPQSYPNYKTASTLSSLVLQRGFASGFDGRCQ